MSSARRPPLPPLLVVDGANVVGSVPDGWWNDRAAAALRLRDGLVVIASDGLRHPSAPESLREGPIDVVLVVEGAARGVPPVPGVRVVEARGSGDDTIVEVVEREGVDRPCVVATADRVLGERVRALGATLTGPRSVHPKR